MVGVVARDAQQVFHLLRVVGAVVQVPAPDQPHRAQALMHALLFV